MPTTRTVNSEKIVETTPQPDMVTEYTMQSCLDNIVRIENQKVEATNEYNSRIAALDEEKAMYQARWNVGIAGGLPDPRE